MEFCDRCGSLMILEKKRKHAFLVCKRCGRKKKVGKVTITTKIPVEKREILVMKKPEEELPKTKIICPKCEHNEAYWWMQQTRGADEPPTLFYRCAKCGYSWRSYG